MDELLSQVRDIFAEVTRYPAEILEPGADLEEDLGIDSVKRAEILTVFMDRFGLPEDLEVAPDELRTIASITEILRRHMQPASAVLARPREVAPAPTVDRPLAQAPVRANGAHAPAGGNGSAPPRSSWEAAAHRAAPPAASKPVLRAAPVGRAAAPLAALSLDELREAVVAVMAEVTGYPRDILLVESDLEDDLGIDSAKLAQIMGALRGRLAVARSIPESAALLRTVGDVVSAAAQLLQHEAAAAPAAARATPALGVGTRPSRPATGPAALIGVRPFAGKIALVTGSGHGIGRAIALRLGELGASVVVNSFHSRQRGEQTARDIEEAGGEAFHVWGSVAKPEQIRRIFAEIERRFGRLDFLVCNASNGMIAPLEQITDEHWDRAFRTNVLSLHQGALLAAPLMRPHGGKIVALSSPGAQRYIEYFGCMGPVKAAVESLTRYLAIELAPDNIQVNAVSAGPIYGELLSKYPDAERLVPYWESLSVGNRLGEESDVANFVTYLLSEAADKITGSVLLLDSGGSQRI
jgi:NAD(P)-dependent dehydrogenase (short-subunit alcohol dehydrogenase family)/acyl carrier protein